MKSHIEILGTFTVDSQASILVFFESYRYLFNVGECLQRYSVEHKVKLTKINHIFVTGNQWPNMGGLPGMLLTIADAGATEIKVSGPKSINSLLAGTRYFCGRFLFFFY